MKMQMSLKVLPILKNHSTNSVYEIVDKIINHIKTYPNIQIVVGPSETSIEGDLETLLEILKQTQILGQKLGCENLFTTIQLSQSPDMWSLEEKRKPYQ